MGRKNSFLGNQNLTRSNINTVPRIYEYVFFYFRPNQLSNSKYENGNTDTKIPPGGAKYVVQFSLTYLIVVLGHLESTKTSEAATESVGSSFSTFLEVSQCSQKVITLQYYF